MKNKYEKSVIGACLLILIIFMVTILIRFCTANILIDVFGMQNEFTQFVFFDRKNEPEQTKYMDWSKIYPFKNKQNEKDVVESKKMDTNAYQKIFEKIRKYEYFVQLLRNSLTKYSQEQLIAYMYMVETSNNIEKSTGWNITALNDYIELEEDIWSQYLPKVDVTKYGNNLLDFQKYCQENDADFLYVQAPYKISKYDDKDISGVLDFSNQNADDMLKMLRKANVDCLDIRDSIRAEGLSHHSLFYKTDHHWKEETGLWATQKIAQHLNEKYQLGIDESLYDKEKWISKTYPKSFLGSQGRSVTLARTSLEDFNVLYPTYNTSFRYQVPAKDIDVKGDFSVFYDLSKMQSKDYYSVSIYDSFIDGRSVGRIENFENPIDKSILFIHDSFGNVVYPFLGTGIKKVDSLDLRHFNGSVENYIKSTKPDIVIVLYNPSILTDITHAVPLFDFQ